MWQRLVNSRSSRVILPILMVLLFMLLIGILYLSIQRQAAASELPVNKPFLQDVMPVKPATCPGSHDL